MDARTCDDALVPAAAQTYRRAFRPADHRLIGGVAAGIADHLGVPVLHVRIAFMALAWLQGVGVIIYLILWRLLPLQNPDLSPGLESATRRGLRRTSTTVRRETIQAVAVGGLGIGVLLVIQASGRGVGDDLFVPLLIGVGGLAVVWRQLDNAAWARWVRGTQGWAFTSRIAAGALLVALAAIYLLSRDEGWRAALNLAAALVIALVGIALLLGPWIARLARELTDERRERVRSQERADVAAHLHDSVLQTLALLQKNSGDAAAVATLARRQERELRSWLYGSDERPGDSFVAALRATGAEIEDVHQVPVEIIAVGDAPLDPDVTALARAAREAMINAARHAGVDRIDVYAESNARCVEVFVRDRGVGFDLDSIAADRMGVRGSIIGRVERHGGSASIRSRPGEGTEVALAMPIRSARPPHEPSEEASS